MGWEGDDRRGTRSAEYVGRERRNIPVILRGVEKHFPWKLVGAIMAVVTFVGGWVTTHISSASDAHSTMNARIDKNTADIAEIKAQLRAMDRTGLLSLQLQLQSRLDKIAEDLRNAATPSYARATLEETQRSLAQQLSEVTRQLDGRR